MNEFMIYAILNVVLILVLSPWYLSLIKIVKAKMQLRKGPSILQSYYNLLKLLKKEVIYSSNASWIMRISPYVNIVCMLSAALFVPFVFIPQAVHGFGNIFVFIYLLGLAKFFMALSGLDAGSSFGGMGSSREMSISAFIEPVLIIIFAALAFVLGTSNMFELFSNAHQLFLSEATIPLLLLGISLFLVLITESARIPVDNPETHLELTMVHEAMILEHSGRNLALMELASAIKQLLLMAILVHLFLPFGLSMSLGPLSIILAIVFFIVKTSILAVIIGLFESNLAKLRLFRLPQLFSIAFFLSLITLLIEVF